MNGTHSLPALPDRLSGNPRSPHHVAEIFEHNIRILFNGKSVLMSRNIASVKAG